MLKYLINQSDDIQLINNIQLFINTNNIVKNIYNMFFNKKLFNLIVLKNTDIDMYDALNINKIVFNMNISKDLINTLKYNNNYICNLELLLSCNRKIIIDTLCLLKFIKDYKENNNLILNLKNELFIKSTILTTFDELKDKIKNIQNLSKNKKLIYTNNLNTYDIFFDIDDEFKEDDVDYIYISNMTDENVCKNFIHIYSNIELKDNFYINRKIKFDKTLFDCYEKVVYIDANIRINSKLKIILIY
jgi:hypothetical protein